MILDTDEVKTVSYFKESRAIMASDFITGSGRHISKLRIPSFVKELSRELKPTKFMTDLYNELGFFKNEISKLPGVVQKDVRGLVKKHPTVQKVVVVVDVKKFNALKVLEANGY